MQKEASPASWGYIKDLIDARYQENTAAWNAAASFFGEHQKETNAPDPRDQRTEVRLEDGTLLRKVHDVNYF